MNHSMSSLGDSGLISLDLMGWTPNLLGCNWDVLGCN